MGEPVNRLKEDSSEKQVDESSVKIPLAFVTYIEKQQLKICMKS